MVGKKTFLIIHSQALVSQVYVSVETVHKYVIIWTAKVVLCDNGQHTMYSHIHL